MSGSIKEIKRRHSEPLTISKHSDSTIDTNSLDSRRQTIIFHLTRGQHKRITFEVSFRRTITIMGIKRKLSSLLDLEEANIIISFRKVPLPDHARLCDIDEDTIEMELKTKDNTLINASKINTLKNGIQIPKQSATVATCKFHVVNQNCTFTKSYKSEQKVQDIKKDLCSTFGVSEDFLILVVNKKILDNCNMLSELDMDDFGNLYLELFTKGGIKLKMDMIYKEITVADVLAVTVATSPSTFITINVEIVDERIKKPFLGGFRNKLTGVCFHHAFSQTQSAKEKIPAEWKNHRDTQTIISKTVASSTWLSIATQTSQPGPYIPSPRDIVLEAKPYIDYSNMVRIKQEKAIVIQKAWKNHVYRATLNRWLKACSARFHQLKMQQLEEQRQEETRLRDQETSKSFPRTREDFDQLYAMVDRWRNNEIARISKLHTKGPKVAEFCLLLDKEIQLLRSIEKFRIELKENFKRKMEIRLLDHLSKPVVWKNSKGKSISMDTLETQQTRQLKELYFSFCQDDMKIDERMELLVNAKYKLDGLQTPLAKELVSLIDRETDLILRNLPSKDLDILRKRIQTTLFELIKSPEIAGSRLKKYQMDQMKDARLYRCHQCNQVKVYTQFPLESRTRQTNICTTCSWSNSTDPTWVDMSPYKRILQAVRREERKRKCWTSMAFVLQEKDIYFLVEKIWHARSVLSEISNIQDLKLCRWNANEEWSPWNCVALTTKEMKNHLKITNLEETYEIGLIDRVRHCHLLAKSYFKQSTNTKNDKDNDISSCSSAE